MGKYIVAYCTGGLGNRLIPLSQCASIAKQSGRELLLFWDEQDPNCEVRFEELYFNPIRTISRDELENLNDAAMFCEGQANHSYECEDVKWGRPMLKHLAAKGAQALHRHAFSFEYQNESIVIHQDGYWYPTVNRGDAYSFLRSLNPTKELQERINQWTDNLRLNKSVYGVHARGTDFHVKADPYIDQIRAILGVKQDARFLLVTDDNGFENQIMAIFPDSVCCRPQQVYLELLDPGKPWGPGNFIRTADQTKEAVIDMHLLAKTNIRISHPDSSFCNVAKIIS